MAASSGDDENMKEEKWSSLVEHVTIRHENCHHGLLNEDRQWLTEGIFRNLCLVKKNHL